MSLRGGGRVRLRRLRAGDLARFQAYRGDAEVARWQSWAPMTDADALAFFEDVAAAPLFVPGRWSQVGIASADSDLLIGDIGLHLSAERDVLEIGFTLAREAHGVGLASEAVALATAMVWEDNPAVERLVAITDSRNTAAVRLLDRGGWRRTALLPASFRGEDCLEQHFVQHRGGRAVFSLRPATADDAAPVAHVLTESRRVSMPFAPSPHSDADVCSWVAGRLLPSGGVTLAERHGRVVGLLATAVRSGCGWIDQLYLLPAHTGAGIGAGLLAHALATLPRPLRLYCFQANRHGRDFYERHRFVALEFSDGRGNEERRPDVLLERRAR